MLLTFFLCGLIIERDIHSRNPCAKKKRETNMR